jgi:hypothetical protein
VIRRRLLDGSGIVVYEGYGAPDDGDGRGAGEDDGGGRRRRGDGDDWRTAC